MSLQVWHFAANGAFELEVIVESNEWATTSEGSSDGQCGERGLGFHAIVLSHHLGVDQVFARLYRD